jgi:hypothetical protein
MNMKFSLLLIISLFISAPLCGENSIAPNNTTQQSGNGKEQIKKYWLPIEHDAQVVEKQTNSSWLVPVLIGGGYLAYVLSI